MNMNMKMDELGRQVNWLDLPTHLMDSISDKLMNHINDFIRFGAVCHSWHSIYTQNRHRLPRQFPGLLLCTEPEPPTSKPTKDRKSHSFYDFIEKKVYKLSLKLPSHADFRGSNQGWLIYEKESQLFLLNPFLPVDNEIHLPPLTAFILDRYGNHYQLGNGQSFIRKAILWGNPTPTSSSSSSSSSSYVVIATDTYSTMIAFYKSGHKEWTSVRIDDEPNYIEDFIYYKHQIYMLEYHKGLFACDVSSNPKVSKVAPPTANVYPCDLVESSGELLALKKSNVGFEGYILDQNLFDWVEINSLSGCSLFLSANFSLSRLCSNYPRWKPNSVYRTIPQSTIVGNEVVSLYRLEDGSIETLQMTESNPIVHSTAIWIERSQHY